MFKNITINLDSSSIKVIVRYTSVFAMLLMTAGVTHTIDTLRQDKKTLKNNNVIANEKIITQEGTIDTKNELINFLNEEQTILFKLKKSIKDSLNLSKDKVNALKKEIKTKENSITILDKKVKKLNIKLEKKDNTISNLKKHNHKLKTENESLSRIVKNQQENNNENNYLNKLEIEDIEFTQKNGILVSFTLNRSLAKNENLDFSLKNKKTGKIIKQVNYNNQIKPLTKETNGILSQIRFKDVKNIEKDTLVMDIFCNNKKISSNNVNLK